MTKTPGSGAFASISIKIIPPGMDRITGIKISTGGISPIVNPSDIKIPIIRALKMPIVIKCRTVCAVLFRTAILLPSFCQLAACGQPEQPVKGIGRKVPVMGDDKDAAPRPGQLP